MTGPAAVASRGTPPVSQPVQDDKLWQAGMLPGAAAGGFTGGHVLNTELRALDGFRAAADQSKGPVDVSLASKVEADAPVNAFNAMHRSDLPKEVGQEIKTILTRIGNDIVDGKLAPNISNRFREDVYKLATEKPSGNGKFDGALANLRLAAEELDRNPPMHGTAMVYDASGNTDVSKAGLPKLNDSSDPKGPLSLLDADLYSRSADGTLRITSSKASVGSLASTVNKGATARETSSPEDVPKSQTGRQELWRNSSGEGDPRRVTLFANNANSGFEHFQKKTSIDELKAAVGNRDERNVVLGRTAYSPNELSALQKAGEELTQAHVAEQRAAHATSGGAEAFDADTVAKDFKKANFATPESMMDKTGLRVGEKLPDLKPLTSADMPSARQGGVWGGAAALGISTAVAASDGKITGEEVLQIGKTTALGTTAGALTAAGEKVVTPMVDRVVGNAIQSATRSVAGVVTSSASNAGSIGAAGRAIGTRALGSSAVGAAIAVGVSAYENRDGLARGDSKAIGNVAADAAVAGTSIAAATAAGAAIGSVVPVAGTAVGAAVGLAVGVGIAYGAQISGARDWAADKVASGVDWVKSWF